MVKEKRNAWIILGLTLTLCVCMGLVDAVLSPPYAVKSAIKLVLFGAVPVIFLLCTKSLSPRRLFSLEKKHLALTLPLAGGVFTVIMVAFFALRGFIDFSSVTDSVTADAGVTRENFIFVALYIALVNSLLEEFFFRGFCFFGMLPLGVPFAYIASALLFSAYHVAFMDGWLSPGIFALSLLGMAMGGVIFAFLNHKTKSLLPSWLVHMASNLATNLIGIIMFYELL